MILFSASDLNLKAPSLTRLVCMCVSTERQNGLVVAVGGRQQRRCKQTVGKKATSYIIEGDVKASSLQGCQCQEAEPGWEQRAPPCLPLQRAAIYIVNTHTLCVFVSLSVSHSSLILSPPLSFTVILSLLSSHSVRLSPVTLAEELRD